VGDVVYCFVDVIDFFVCGCVGFVGLYEVV